MLSSTRIILWRRWLADAAAGNNQTAANGMGARKCTLVSDPLERSGIRPRNAPVAEAFTLRISPRTPNEAFVQRADAAAALRQEALLQFATVAIHRGNSNVVALCAGWGVGDAVHAAGLLEIRGDRCGRDSCSEGCKLVLEQPAEHTWADQKGKRDAKKAVGGYSSLDATGLDTSLYM